jgi:hypothetical protein
MAMVNFKKILIYIPGPAGIIGLIFGYPISYKPTMMVYIFLWGILMPSVVFAFLYFMYFKKNSILYITEWKKYQQGKWTDKVFTPPVCILFISAMITMAFWCYFALASDFVAKQPFLEKVIVRDFHCKRSSRTFDALELTVTSVNNPPSQEYIVDFSYRICEKYSDLSWLRNQRVVLYGREWFAGKVYDGIVDF